MKIEINTLTPELFLELYSSVGWEAPCTEQVNAALRNTLATFTCYDGNHPVGMVRVIGDGGMSFYIKDFAVVPACQGKGVGKRTGTLCEGMQAFGLGCQSGIDQFQRGGCILSEIRI